MSEKQQLGRTAMGVALSRAAHTLYAEPPMYRDEWAIRLLDEDVRAMLEDRARYETEFLPGSRAFASISAASFACARYTEEQVEEALSRGIAQKLVLGAGLDSFGLRRQDLGDRLRVFELDHPNTQAIKRERILAEIPALPTSLELVPIDFEVTSLAAALAKSSYDTAKQSFASWLGTVPYLTPEAFYATLSHLSELLAPGSELTFNYATPTADLSPEDREMIAALRENVKQQGEPWQSSFVPEELHAGLEERGFDLVAEFTMADLGERYFTGRSDGLWPTATAGRLAHVRRR